MANGRPSDSYVLDFRDSYFECSRHGRFSSPNLHFADGTHRLADPVSKTTWNSCGGVPSPIEP